MLIVIRWLPLAILELPCIHPGVLTPDHPRLTARQLGRQFVDPTIFLSGGQASLNLTGYRASKCPGQIGEIIPAGSMKC